ncbi:MAG: cupin, partial [Mesorhizobium sp.]
MRNVLASALLTVALSATAANALDSGANPVVVTPLADRTETASG